MAVGKDFRSAGAEEKISLGQWFLFFVIGEVQKVSPD